jgi:hypothetical protein
MIFDTNLVIRHIRLNKTLHTTDGDFDHLVEFGLKSLFP